jgi:hypothetical protein
MTMPLPAASKPQAMEMIGAGVGQGLLLLLALTTFGPWWFRPGLLVATALLGFSLVPVACRCAWAG